MGAHFTASCPPSSVGVLPPPASPSAAKAALRPGEDCLLRCCDRARRSPSLRGPPGALAQNKLLPGGFPRAPPERSSQNPPPLDRRPGSLGRRRPRSARRASENSRSSLSRFWGRDVRGRQGGGWAGSFQGCDGASAGGCWRALVLRGLQTHHSDPRLNLHLGCSLRLALHPDFPF